MSITTTAVDSTDAYSYYGITASDAQSDLDLAAFMKLLVVQLQNQNPLEPMSDSEFYAQLAQMGTVQGVQNMATITEANQAASLIGKTVTASVDMTDSSSGTSSSVTGTVVSSIVKNGVNYIGVQEDDGGVVEVKVANVTEVSSSTPISNYTGLIGKTVFAAVNSGTTDDPVYTAVSGTVDALYVESGVNMAQISGTDGNTYEVELSTVSAIKS